MELDLNSMPYEKTIYSTAAIIMDTVNANLHFPWTLPHNISRWVGNTYKQIKYPPNTADPPIKFTTKKIAVTDIYRSLGCFG